tara:strand:+ start:651 stop:839 length:189 start_codon:yes stop_codon:yes gene_type:complete
MYKSALLGVRYRDQSHHKETADVSTSIKDQRPKVHHIGRDGARSVGHGFTQRRHSVSVAEKE